MKYLQAVILLLSVFLISSCNENVSEKKRSYWDKGCSGEKRSEVMAIHDEIMPGMGVLMNLKKQLKEKAAAMDSTKDIDKKLLDAVCTSIEQLEIADEEMMQWMRTYKDPADSVSQKEAIAYLELKEQEIYEVKEKIFDLAQRSYMVSALEDESAPGGVAHSGAFLLIDSKRRIRGHYDRTKAEEVDKLMNDMNILLKEEAAQLVNQ